jgi:ABC-type phosphate/phosphonate transport system substrate-binding protein
MKIGKLNVAFVLLGIFLSFQLSAAQAMELKFGFTPVLSEAEMKEEFQPLMDYLIKSTGIEVTLYIAKSYGDLRDQMEAEKVDIGSFSPYCLCGCYDRRQNKDYRPVYSRLLCLL